MVLHIGLEGIDDLNRGRLCIKLRDFMKKKHYKTVLQNQPGLIETMEIIDVYDLSNYEMSLLSAFDRSYIWNSEDWENYDLIIWNGTILKNYVENTDNNVTRTFIRNINKNNPDCDLYIILQPNINNLPKNYQSTPAFKYFKQYKNIEKTYKNTVLVEYNPKNPDSTFTDIVKAVFDNLPRCNWCGRLFKPNKQFKKYCQEKCSNESLTEQYRRNNREYYERHKHEMTERQKGALGTKGANLHGTNKNLRSENPDFIKELYTVRNAKRALRLKPIK